MAKDPRDTSHYNIVGTNGTGKSTFANNMMQTVAQVGRRCLVIDFDAGEQMWRPYEHIDLSDYAAVQSFTGIRKAHWSEYPKNEALNHLMSAYNNGLLVMDDCRQYLIDLTDSVLANLCIRRRQKMLDLVFIAHGVDDLPPRIWRHYTDLILFRTVSDPDKRKKELSNFQYIRQRWQVINRIASQEGNLPNGVPKKYYCEHIKSTMYETPNKF